MKLSLRADARRAYLKLIAKPWLLLSAKPIKLKILRFIPPVATSTSKFLAKVFVTVVFIHHKQVVPVEIESHWLLRAGTNEVIGEDLCLAGVQRQTARGKLVDQRSEHHGALIHRVPV